MKLGFNEATCMKKSDVMTDLNNCEKYGYDYIELRLDMIKEYLKTNTLDDLAEYFNTHNIKPFALNSIEDINFCNEEQWNDVVELFTFACEVSKAIKNPYIIVVPTMGEAMKLKAEYEVFEDSVKVLNMLADIAEPYGAKLAFEPIGDRRWACNSLREAHEIVNAVDRDNVGLALDCINFYLNDKCADVAYIRKIPREKMFVFHINDCEDLPFGILDHEHRIFPGDGCIPIGEMVNALKDIGYDEIASLELFRPEYWEMEPEDVIRIGAEKSRQFF